MDTQISVYQSPVAVTIQIGMVSTILETSDPLENPEEGGEWGWG